MEEYAAEEYPDIEIVATVYGDDEDEKSFQETQGLLQSHPDLKGIISPTTVGISAAAQISDLFDFVDLDGAMLLADDPFDVDLEAAYRQALQAVEAAELPNRASW